MGAAFEALGRPLPPWRCLDAVAAKWQPKRFTDVPVSDGLLDAGASRGRPPQRGEAEALERLLRDMVAHGVA